MKFARPEPRNYTTRAELGAALKARAAERPFRFLSLVLFYFVAHSPLGFWIIPSDYGPGTEPYLLRAYLTPRWFPFEIFLHFFFRGDAQRDELHNHPWAWALSWIFSGGYVEHYTDRVFNGMVGAARVRVLRAHSLNLIRSSTYHRITLSSGDTWSVFVCGPRVRDWGFLGVRGYTPHGLRKIEREAPEIVRAIDTAVRNELRRMSPSKIPPDSVLRIAGPYRFNGL